MVGRHFGRLDKENPHLLLGRGQFSDVFRGKLNGSMEVAIKRIVQENQPDPRYNQIAAINPDTQSSKRENEALRQLDHPNVIKLLHVEEHNSIKYFALELCAATLYQYCMRQYNGPMPPDAVVLLHIVRGLRHVHSKGFAHRNIEPKNILISKSFPTRIILADFGLSKSVSNTSGSYSVSQDRSMNDQLCWLAAELLDNPDDQGFSEKRRSIASDIFSAGCVFYFYLTPGWHPFGSDLDSTQRNIFYGEPVLLNHLPQEQYRFKSMIEAMISKNPEHRTTCTSLERLEKHLEEIIGPYLFEREPEFINIPDEDGQWQDERPDWLM